MPQYSRAKNNLQILGGNAHPVLTQSICDYIGIPQAEVQVTSFADGETSVQILENVRGTDVFIVQPTCSPTNRNLMELLIMIDAARRASAKRITAVLPYFGYARQDRKDRPRVPITAKLVANLIDVAGADRVLSIDLHTGQLQGFFDIPVDHIFAAPVFNDYLRSLDFDSEKLVVISPDPGGGKRARAYGKLLNAPIAFIDKRRPKPNVSEALNVVGDVKGKHAIITDDLADTGGTLAASAVALMNAGAVDVYACCTHAVLSGQAVEKICKSPLKQLVVTDTIPLGEKACERFQVKSVASLLGEAIKSIHEETSVGRLFIDFQDKA